MTILVAMLALNTVLHGFLIGRFGAKGNVPVLVFTFIYAALTLAVFFELPFALWATLILSAIGLAGLTVTFGQIARDKSIDRVIWGLDVAVVAYVAYIMFVR